MYSNVDWYNDNNNNNDNDNNNDFDNGNNNNWIYYSISFSLNRNELFCSLFGARQPEQECDISVFRWHDFAL